MTRQAKHYAVVFLNDGETWTTIEGCSIVILTAKELDYLQNQDRRPEDLNTILEIGLDDCTDSPYQECEACNGNLYTCSCLTKGKHS